jgi:hypothetical protein
MKPQTKILDLPPLDFFGDWETLQNFLKRKGNPLFTIDGDLNLRRTQIQSLDNLVSVGGYLDLRQTPLSEKYSEKEIRNMIDVKGKIYL